MKIDVKKQDFLGKLLIIDDSPVNVLLLKKYFCKRGYDIISSDNGDNGIKLAIEEQPDIILLDVMMPQKNGYDVCEELKGDSRTKKIPVFFISAKTEIKAKIRGLDTGAVDYITKPFNLEEIFAKVKVQIKLRKTSKRLEDTLEYIKEDIKHAAIIQKALIPSKSPNIKGLDFTWLFRPSFYVSGDIFNIIELDDKNIGIYIADVSGHGVAAAMLAVLLSQYLSTKEGGILKEKRKDAYNISSPRYVCQKLNENFSSEEFGNLFFTFFYATINLEKWEVHYSRAAHPAPFLLGNNGTLQRLNEGGIPIGMFSDKTWDEGKISLKKGDTLFMFSDGLIEAQKKRIDDIEEFTEERLEKIIVDSINTPLAKIPERVIEEVVSFCGDSKFEDDVTLIGIKRV